MIQLISDLACSLFCVTVNGFVSTLFWLIYEKKVRPYGYWKQSYILLKILIVTILIPWQFIPFVLYEKYILHGWRLIIPQYDISIALSILLLVWACGAIRKGIIILFQFHQEKAKLKCREKADTDTERQYKSIAAKMGLNRIPRLYKTEEYDVPFLFHSIPAVIYLPKIELDQDQLVVSLQHELTHYIHRDNIWAWLVRICRILQWWNPFIDCLESQYIEWSEYANDSDVIRKYCDKNHYFETIMCIIDNHEKKEVFGHGLGVESSDEIEMRVDMFKKSRKSKSKKKGGIVNVLLSMTLIACVSVTLFLDSVASHAYYMVYHEVSKLRDVKEENESDALSEQTETGFPENMMVRTGEVTFANSERSVAEFNWNVPVNTTVTSDSFYLNKGQQVIITIATTNPTNISVKYGLLRVATNTKTYVTASAPTTHVFTATVAGYYRVFVENTLGTAFSVYGSYMII